ncbi:hypothetical protein AN639_12195 [Candidatus Epulonipiscium fishelsonii]|uniref:Uncharacterized protein n=1 Tax=Candidatus Epulonipiscium fishelsonii TaxID=77094 RepID=A0ACC8XG09_9FIRM|nr:hypothetical protein AN396_02375 [Epulopiscium sp. SCG-B11WGA-EpuloA1]ONI42525.1 hypothetical protein AN639_12195 [Epulopiscium sp. SCG-B05WGA-EpuloA1]
MDNKNDDKNNDYSLNHEPNYYYEVVKSNRPKKKSSSGIKKFILGTVIVSLVGGVAIGTSFAVVTNQYNDNLMAPRISLPTSVQPTQMSFVEPIQLNNYNTISEIAEDVGPSIVSIVSVVPTEYSNFWISGIYPETGLGSGVIFYEDAEKIYIMTNSHVVEDANTLTVTFLGNYKVSANIVGQDALTDIAVVSVNKSELPEEAKTEIKLAPLGNNDSLRVGDLAIAIGTPLDEAYSNTVTVGIISALNRTITLDAQNKMELIQTDAAINPGNSGGALIGPTGEVIGINTIKLVDDHVEGMGFAIPINNVKPIVEELISYGKVLRPSLGISGITFTQELSQFDIPVGVYVHQVMPNSSAELAGILAEDIILEFDGVKLSTMEELKSMIEAKNIGDNVKMKVSRNGKILELDVVLSAYEHSNTSQPTPKQNIPFSIPNFYSN